MTSDFKIIGLTRLIIKPKSQAPEADAQIHSAIRAVMFTLKKYFSYNKRSSSRRNLILIISNLSISHIGEIGSLSSQGEPRSLSKTPQKTPEKQDKILVEPSVEIGNSRLNLSHINVSSRKVRCLICR